MHSYRNAVQHLSDLYDDRLEEILKSVEGRMSEFLENMPHPRISPRRNPYTPIYKEGEKQVSEPSALDVDKAIAHAIGKAMRHAERVSRREHIKADRIERVNQFIVSLRRELGDIGRGRYVSANINAMLDKGMWYDIGIPVINFNHFGNLTRDQVQRWVTEANRIKQNNTDAMRYEIEGDLEELERGLQGCQSACENAKRINQESEQIASQLCALFS